MDKKENVMKKFDWEEFRAYIILTIVVLIMIGIMLDTLNLEREKKR